MSEAVLKTSGLTKRFFQRAGFFSRPVLAVDGLNLEVRPAEILGFLGPNAAGKTTTLNMVVGLIPPTSGTIELFGRRLRPGDPEPLRRIGYVPETTVLPEYLTVRELLDFFAYLFGLSLRDRRERIASILDITGLSKEKGTLISNLSMGQRRLVDIAQALVNDPDLVILDEPTVYLDPLILERFRATLTALRDRGKAVLMSSHMLAEIEKLCDRVAVIDAGRLLKVARKEEFLEHGSMEEEFLRIIRHEHP